MFLPKKIRHRRPKKYFFCYVLPSDPCRIRHRKLLSTTTVVRTFPDRAVKRTIAASIEFGEYSDYSSHDSTLGFRSRGKQVARRDQSSRKVKTRGTLTRPRFQTYVGGESYHPTKHGPITSLQRQQQQPLSLLILDCADTCHYLR